MAKKESSSNSESSGIGNDGNSESDEEKPATEGRTACSREDQEEKGKKLKANSQMHVIAKAVSNRCDSQVVWSVIDND